MFRIWSGRGQDMANMWPGCGQNVTWIWPWCGNDVAMMWPSCCQDVARLWPGYGYIMTRVWVTIGQINILVHVIMVTNNNRSCYFTFPFEAKWKWIIALVLDAKSISTQYLIEYRVYYVSISKLLYIPKFWLPRHRNALSHCIWWARAYLSYRKYMYFLLPSLCLPPLPHTHTNIW